LEISASAGPLARAWAARAPASSSMCFDIVISSGAVSATGEIFSLGEGSLVGSKW